MGQLYQGAGADTHLVLALCASRLYTLAGKSLGQCMSPNAKDGTHDCETPDAESGVSVESNLARVITQRKAQKVLRQQSVWSAV